jgi:lysophospholipase L1-like esterase
MPTITAGTSATITLPAGRTFSYSGGSGSVLVYGPGPAAGQPYALQSVGTLGPFGEARTLYVSAQTAVTYSTDGPVLAGGLTDAQADAGATGVAGVTQRGLIVGSAGQAIAQPPNVFSPWKIATFGDSRSNTGSTGPDIGGSQTILETRGVSWGVALMGDAELVGNYGVSGDAAASWASTSRTGGKTIGALSAQDVDLVIVQYGINDAIALTSASTVTGYLQALIQEIMKSNKLVLFESIQPLGSAATNAVAAQAIADAVNASMQAWLANFSGRAVFCDTATALKAGGSLVASAYQNTDGVHTNRNGAYVAGNLIAAKARELLPRRIGLYPARDNRNTNMLSMVSAAACFINAETGTISGASITQGQDSDGNYVEYLFTPATFVSSECKVRIESNANFLTSANPFYALNGAEVLQGSARVVVDDGAGGAPSVYGAGLRQRFYTAAVFRDWGTIPQGVPTANTPAFTERMDALLITPAVVNTAASVSATPSAGTGYSLQFYVSSSTTTPVRVRLYNPQLRVVGYKTTPVTVTPPASGSAYTNATNVKQQAIVSGGTVSAIAQGGVTTGLTAGVFVLDPGDTLTLTYTVAPTLLVKHLATI